MAYQLPWTLHLFQLSFQKTFYDHDNSCSWFLTFFDLVLVAAYRPLRAEWMLKGKGPAPCRWACTETPSIWTGVLWSHQQLSWPHRVGMKWSSWPIQNGSQSWPPRVYCTEARAPRAPIKAWCRSPAHTNYGVSLSLLLWAVEWMGFVMVGSQNSINSSFSLNTSYCQRVTRQHSLCFNFFFLLHISGTL